MTALAPQWLFLILGPFFLVAAVVRCAVLRRFAPQVRTWLILGVLFCFVAAWLWLVRPPVT